MPKITIHPWSPDGNRIAFSSKRDGNFEIYAMKVDRPHITRLTHSPDVDQDPTWAPSGNRIAFSSKRDGNFEIYVMKADGTDVTRLTNHNAEDYYPSWSPF